MARLLSLGLWSGTTLGVLGIVFIIGYAAGNDSGHTGWEPFTSLGLFVPLTLVGAVGLALRGRFTGVARASIWAVTVGLVGVALIVTLDRTNRLVQYERWIDRGMP